MSHGEETTQPGNGQPPKATTGTETRPATEPSQITGAPTHEAVPSPEATLVPDLPTHETPPTNPSLVAETRVDPVEPANGPKLVRRVVCSYNLGWLPGDWLQTWRRLDRMFNRAGLRVKATLAPLEDLPEDTDILVVPPELREAAREAVAPGTPILVTPASAAAGAFADLVAKLEAGTEFTAEKVDAADKDKPKIVSYRGHTLLD